MKNSLNKFLSIWLFVILMMSFLGLTTLTSANAYTTHDQIYINGNADFTWENGVTGGTGTQSDPYIIESWDISALSANGIEIRNTDAYFTIRNCYVHDGGVSYNGIYFYNVQNGRVENTISLNSFYGIYLKDSSNNNIFNNNVSNIRCGLLIVYSSNNNIFNNSASNNWCGIHLGYSSDNNIFNNSASNNWCGILVFYSSNNNNISNNNALNNGRGIYLGYSSNNHIFNNSVLNNYRGIHLESSSNNDISNNSVLNNYYGYLFNWNSYKNRIYHNNFIDNIYQGYDREINQWDNGYPSGGNYWSDYTGVDEKSGLNQDRPGSDGIGDTPYNIAGGLNTDRYPLMSPWGRPKSHEISVEKEFIPSEITTINQEIVSAINVTNIGDVDITSMTITDKYIENIAPNDPPEVLVTITSDEGEVFAIQSENLTVTSDDTNITISFELPLEVVPVFWENNMLQFSEGTYYLESILKGWVVGIQYLLNPITELKIGTYCADAIITAYSETGASVTGITTGTLIVLEHIETAPYT